LIRKYLAYSRATRNVIARSGKTIAMLIMRCPIKGGFTKLGMTPGGGGRAPVKSAVRFIVEYARRQKDSTADKPRCYQEESARTL